MAEQRQEIRKLFTFFVDVQDKLYSPRGWELPKKTKLVKGIQLTSDLPDRLYYRGAQRVEIGGDEIFPEGFESRILMSSLSVPPRERFFNLGEVPPGDLSVKVRFQDKAHDRARIGNGYRVSVILLLDEEI